VLKNVSFEVQPRQKVGIVGRTGSGKSTLALTLLRFLDQSEGRILVSDVDIGSINLPDLRSRITIIPQDPVLFSGTIRTNLDPFNQHDDATLNDALRQSHLNVDEANLTPEQQLREDERVRITLDSTVSENGSNFSQGQRQLIALARALVRQSKVLIMDEATASVDRETDDKIQATIRNEFGESTLLTIAHRLRTVADFDRILVLDHGRVVEYDEPYKLIKDDKTIFHSMCKKSGEYNELFKVAKAHHMAIKVRDA
jgi:ABC-type multidrug transport system fused ATPase/permease subunit